MDWLEVAWTGPYQVERASSVKAAGDFGVYAIYDQATRARKLLYVGRTYWQNFGKRLVQHRREWLDGLRGSQAVHYGAVKAPAGKRITFEKVRDVEEFLIHFYRPPYNTASKKGYLGRDLLLVNTGKSGTLDRVVSNDDDLLRFLRRRA